MREITGRHVLFTTVGAFSVIIAVNLVLAWKAVSTFPGLEVSNSYVASQDFDARRTAQESLGWTLTHGYDTASGELRLALTDRDGRPAALSELGVLLGRPTEARDDTQPKLAYADGEWREEVDLRPGKWLLRVTAVATNGTLFEQRVDFFVRG